MDGYHSSFIASLTTDNSTVFSTVCSIYQPRKHQIEPLWRENTHGLNPCAEPTSANTTHRICVIASSKLFQVVYPKTLNQRSAIACLPRLLTTTGPLFTSGRTSYRRISWSRVAARSNVIIIVSLWNLTGISTALPPRCLSNFRAVVKV